MIAAAALTVLLGTLTPVNLPGISTLAGTPTLDGGTLVEFTKTSEERRLLAFLGVPEGDPEGAMALQVIYRLRMSHGEAPRLALVVFTRDGGSWYRVSGRPLAPGDGREGRLSVADLRQTAFSRSERTELDWADVERVWVGLVMDGPAEGMVEIAGAHFTDARYVPTEPVRVTGDGPGRWHSAQDSAITANLTVVDEGPEGQPCMRYEFTTPTGRHMYALPGVTLTETELEGYSAVRFRAMLGIPQGMRLLVQLTEHSGAIYYVEREGPWSREWQTLAFRFDEFHPAGWGPRDPNEQLDIRDVRSVTIGAHGGPAEANGLIMATDIEFLP